MNTLKKLVWSEGTILSQQHFQQWDHFWEDSYLFQMKALQPYFWGISHLEIDESALLSGRFRVKQCNVIFPHGKIITFDSEEYGELCCELLKKQSDHIEIFLCLAFSQHIQGLNGYEVEHDICGLKTHYEYICDQYDHHREREIAFAIPILYLLDGSQSREQYAQIKIAEIRCYDNDQYQLIKQFIPSVIHISSSLALNDFLERVLNLLSAKATSLIERRANYTDDFLQIGHNELIHFLLLQIINQYLPILKEFKRQRLIHPWELYRELIKLLGGLVVFIQVDEHMEIPNYDHSDLNSVFNTLERQLQYVIDQAMPSNMIKLDLVKQSDSLYLIDHIDHHLFTGYSFYLAVKVTSNDMVWINRFLQQIKISSQTDIQPIIGSAVQAVDLRHLQRNPNNLPIKSGYEYFYLEQQGEYWSHIIETGNLALFISHEFTGALFEILVIRE